MKKSNLLLVINMLIGFIVAFLGDIICQYLHASNEPLSIANFLGLLNGKSNSILVLDFNRTIQMGLIRAFFISPFNFTWYPWLVELLPGTDFLKVICRVAVDQSVGSIICISMMFFLSSLLEGDLYAFPLKIYDNLLLTMIEGWKFWPFIILINFRFTPLHLQPFVTHVASLYWSVILSYYNHLN
jgi:hypothetical protein